MKRNTITACLFTLLALTNATAQQNPSPGKIIIEGEIPASYNPEMNKLYAFTSSGVISNQDYVLNTVKGTIQEGQIRWTINTDKPTRVRGQFLADERFLGVTMMPGDSIHVRHENNRLVYSGKGQKIWEMVFNLKQIEDSLDNVEFQTMISSRFYPVTSVQDYLRWNTFLNVKISTMLPVLESFKSKVAPSSYKETLHLFYEQIEKRRLYKFNTLRISNEAAPRNHLGLSNQDLCMIFDSTMNNSISRWLRYEAEDQVDMYYQWFMLKLEMYREKGQFFRTNKTDTFGTEGEAAQYLEMYNQAKNKFKGIMREKLLAYTFWDKNGLLAEIGFGPKSDSLLNDYYSQPGYLQYKKMVKSAEVKYREKHGREFLPQFSLTDINKQKVTNKELSGKILVMDFWFTGCTGCIQLKPALENVEKYFKTDSNVLFVRVSIDKSFQQWAESVMSAQYTPPGGLQLYTNGEGSKHSLIKNMMIGSYPSILIINQLGRIVPYNSYMIDPRLDEGVGLISLITRELAISKDGPYIFHEGDSLKRWKFDGEKVFKSIQHKSSARFSATSHINKQFPVELNSDYEIPPSIYERPDSLLVLSDIEGNFDVFVELLTKHGVIDEKFNWKFGKGHLVFAGDMFDRGKQVTECLWLIYSLEKKARLANGFVHFILGNHEIMNLQGDQRYVDEKYLKNATSIGMTIRDLYGSNSELGIWLRSKNIMERIGDLLFVHGGISQNINNLNLTIEQINSTARPGFDKLEKPSNDTAIIMGYYGPLWYRGYYEKKIATEQIDSTLAKFNARHIITGHTVISDTITVHYNGKLFNTDTKHYAGASEVLYISGKKFYRANREGRRVLIYSEEQHYKK